MEDWSRSLLFTGSVMVLGALAASWVFCLGLSDIVHWTYCEALLSKAQALVELITRLRDAVWSP